MFGKRKDDFGTQHGQSNAGDDTPAGASSSSRADGADTHGHDGCGCGHGGCGGDGGQVHDIGPDDTQALIESLAHERDDFKDKWLRAMAEYQNFQRRAIANEQEAKRQGVASVLMSVVPVLDSLDMALANLQAGAGSPGAEAAGSGAVAEGVRAVQQGLLAALGAHGVSVIRPAPGDEFDPNRHSAIVQLPGVGADGSPIEPGRVSQTLQVGYALSAHGQDRVIRSAKVAVVPG